VVSLPVVFGAAVGIPDEVRAPFVAAVAIEDVDCMVVTFATNKSIESIQFFYFCK